MVTSAIIASLVFGNLNSKLLEEHPAEWTTPIEPFRITENLFYVGSQDLASYLVTTPKGHILINANLDSSPPLIKSSVEKLKFRWKDIKIVLNSQAHMDHVGGLAQILKETGAKNFVMEWDAEVVKSGGETDFIPSLRKDGRFQPAKVDRVLHHQSKVSLGGITLTAHKTAGHTRGCTTWTMASELPTGKKKLNVVIVGGTGFWSEFKLVSKPNDPESYPGIAQDFRKTFSLLEKLPCDIFLGAHGIYFDLESKLKKSSIIGGRAFVDPAGYKVYIKAAKLRFMSEFKKQKTASCQ